jgi:hypothetical protein
MTAWEVTPNESSLFVKQFFAFSPPSMVSACDAGAWWS